MISEKAVEALELAINFEFNKITADHGEVYASEHEAYAVLLEEVEEAREAYKCMKIWLKAAWRNIKANENNQLVIEKIKEEAIELIKESVQCAAVCERFLETIKREEKHEGLS